MTDPTRPVVRIVGPGRAGTSFAAALAAVGWEVAELLGPAHDPVRAVAGVDLVLLTTPDSVVQEVADRIAPDAGTVVAHVAGSLGLEVLAAHPRRASVHPLMALPGGEAGGARLRSGGWFAVAGDPFGRQLVEQLGGRTVEVADPDRAAYHAAAAVASNHLVALLGQVERIAAGVGVPLAAYLDLARGSLEDVAERGPAAALTGPVARGDEATIAAHLAAIDPAERPAYEAMVAEARRLLP